MNTRRFSISVNLAFGVAAFLWGISHGYAASGPNPAVNYNVPNYANSPILRKFVDSLPRLGFAGTNNLGQYLPIAIADTNTYPGSDYYQIGLIDYTQRMHSDLPATKLRGYKDLNPAADGAAHYLGPIIIAQRDRPTRIKFSNMLGTGTNGNLFLPVDTTVMGAGMGTDTNMMENYTQNRAVIHLHGGFTPWISDGTPHQWITPAGEVTSYPKGMSQQNVPDMPDPGPGSATYYYSNQQSARLMFYHDHAYGITRLNVYAGEAAGYVLQDPVEQELVASGIIPAEQIPLIIQDKTFVPDATMLAATDPLWDTANWGGMGNLWFPHVYMPNQDPTVPGGFNPMGRWDYGPWFWPVFSVSAPLPEISIVPEAFMDTPVVNGTAYPYLDVQPKAYRFRILNVCNDRSLNLQLYHADSKARVPKGLSKGTEVKMVPAVFNAAYPPTWPTDGRDGGVPDPATAGPMMIQIGTEGGFLPTPVVITNQPIGYDYNRRDVVVLNVSDHALFIGPAERADVIIDFSQVKPGSKIILYNDAPAPVPAFDERYDYYTGDPDQTASGGTHTTLPGYGPNTRTIMQFRVGKARPTPFDLAALQRALPTAFASSQPAPFVPEVAYGAVSNSYGQIFTGSLDSPNFSFTDTNGVPRSLPVQNKAIQELFDSRGRMNATLGVELPFTTALTQTTIPLGYVDPPTETVPDGETQIWKITHNGVDTHAIHFHLVNVQLINRVGWDGMLRPPDPNELGWKETVRMNPLEDVIVALRPSVPSLPFSVPDSVRPLNPAMPLGSTNGFTGVDPQNNNPIIVTNEMTNFGWEYAWHCHLLGHEENDMMRPFVMTGATNYVTLVSTPLDLAATVAATTQVNLSWTDNSNNETGFRIERATGLGAFVAIGTNAAGVATYNDTTVVSATTYSYRVIAFNASGDSLPSNTAMITTAAPAPPSNLVATATSSTTVSLTWADNSNNETGFSIQRATNAGFTKGLTTVSVGANVTTHTDTTALAKKKYYYRVLASNAIGNSAYSNTATVTTP